MGIGDRDWVTSAGVGEGGRDPRSASQPEPQSTFRGMGEAGVHSSSARKRRQLVG